MGLKPDLLCEIYDYGFECPTAVHERVIVPIVSGRSAVIQAPSGTGKTAAFVIASLQSIDSSVKEVQAAILAPTRELSMGIHQLMIQLGKFLDVDCMACVGGYNVQDDTTRLQTGGVQLIVGTPGRIGDMIRRSALKTDKLKILCLEEADEMLDREFKGHIHELLEGLVDVQVVLSTSGLSLVVLEVVEDTMRDPIRVIIDAPGNPPEGIKQFFIPSRE